MLKVGLFSLLWSVTWAAAQAPHSQYDPSVQHPVQRKDGVVDFALQRINPNDLDYGQRIEEARRSALEATLYSYGFWSDVAAGIVLGTMFVVVFWQKRQKQRIQLNTARLVLAYQNELAAARDQLARLNAEYSRAKRLLENHREAHLGAAPRAAKGDAAALNNNSNKTAAPAAHQTQPSLDQLLLENSSLKQQAKILTGKLQEEQQKNRKLKGE